MNNNDYIINLTPGFEPHGKQTINYEYFLFPSKVEPHIKISEIENYSGEPVYISIRLNSMEAVFKLLLCVNALNHMEIHNICIFIPYIPFGRQDRLMMNGEPFSLKVFAEIINFSIGSCKFITFDQHSDVTSALIENMWSMSNAGLVNTVIFDHENASSLNTILVSPDAGAYKKIYHVAQELTHVLDILCANKIRDIRTGKILNIDVNINKIKDKHLFIIDDICEGGRTFLMLNEELRKGNPASVNLIVSHGIFSNGTEELVNAFDSIYTTDSFYSTIKNINVIPLNEII